MGERRISATTFDITNPGQAVALQPGPTVTSDWTALHHHSMDSLDSFGMDEAAKSFAFMSTVLVNFVDQLGTNFLLPLLVPVGMFLGGESWEIALFGTVRGFTLIFSTIWMSKLSDYTSRRLVILLSLIGSGLAYSMQGYAVYADHLRLQTMPIFTNAAIFAFIAARGIAGFFSGTSPVLKAFVADLYDDDPIERKQKMALLEVSSQAVGMTLSPVAGSIASFSLDLPYMICAVVVFLGLAWAAAFFPRGASRPEPTEIVSAAEHRWNAPPAARGFVRRPLRSPWRDGAVVLITVGFLCIAMLLLGATGYLLPTMLFEKSEFGLNKEANPDLTEEEVAGKVAQVIGLLSLPYGVANIFITLFVFGKATERFGWSRCILTAGLIATSIYPQYGRVSTIWQICLLHTTVGACFGILLPAAGPIMSQYAEAFYPDRKAEVQSIPLMGMSIGMMLGQSILDLVLTAVGLRNTWLVCGGLMLMCTLSMSTGTLLIATRIARVQEDADDDFGDVPLTPYSIFTKEVLDMVQAQLSKHEKSLQSRAKQQLLKNALTTAIVKAKNVSGQVVHYNTALTHNTNASEIPWGARSQTGFYASPENFVAEVSQTALFGFGHRLSGSTATRRARPSVAPTIDSRL